MKLNRYSLLCTSLTAVLALSACEGASPAPAAPESTTTAASAVTSTEATTSTAAETAATAEQTTAPAETTTTAVETAEPEQPRENTFPTGVYWAHCGAQSGDRYYQFNGTDGGVINQEMGIGAPFNYEVNGEDIMFHMLSADDNTPAKIVYENGIPAKLIFEYEGEQILEYMGDITLDDFTYYTDIEIGAMMRNYLRIIGKQEPYTALTSDTANELIEVNVRLGDGSEEKYYVDRFTSTCTDADGNILININTYHERIVNAKPWDPIVIQRQVIFDYNAPLGAAYLGGIEWFTSPRPYYDQILEQSGWTENMECLAELPDDHITGTITGKELYLIIPQQPDMEIKVWKMEPNADGELEKTQQLYYSEDGAPFLLKCNSNEIYPDTLVNIWYPDDDMYENVYTWTPQLSGDDGHIVTRLDEPEGGNIYDMTIAYAGDVQSD